MCAVEVAEAHGWQQHTARAIIRARLDLSASAVIILARAVERCHLWVARVELEAPHIAWKALQQRATGNLGALGHVAAARAEGEPTQLARPP